MKDKRTLCTSGCLLDAGCSVKPMVRQSERSEGGKKLNEKKDGGGGTEKEDRTGNTL